MNCNTNTPGKGKRDLLPMVHISVLNWNGYAHTISCLASLVGLDYPNFKIIVVDNNSRDNSVRYIRAAYPDIIIICAEENLGYAGGHELALNLARQANADLLWLVNTDMEFKTDTLAELVYAYLRRGEGIYGSLPLHSHDHSRIGFTAWAVDVNGKPEFSRKVLAWDQPYREILDSGLSNAKEIQVANVHGCSMMIPLSVVKNHGFMDNSFFLYTEEYDYCFRLAKSGLPSFIVLSSVVLHGRMSNSKYSQKLKTILEHYYMTRNFLVLKRRHWGYRACFGEILKKLKRSLKLRAKFMFSSHKFSALCPKHYYRYLGVRDALLLRMGKTIKPGDFLDESVSKPDSFPAENSIVDKMPITNLNYKEK
ncbi:MAG: glycosyltransferase family 2 protein [Deltaproteobacteria bacterium]|nr:glycosyltransferase family 2 protein [Deltaproteobacteria bacterium]